MQTYTRNIIIGIIVVLALVFVAWAWQTATPPVPAPELEDNATTTPPLIEEEEEPIRPISQLETVKVFFSNKVQDPEMIHCDSVYPTNRVIATTPAVARAALNELFKGTTVAEEAQGFFTSINSGVVIQDLTISGGVASVDLNPELERQVGGACSVSAIRAQITETLRQFPSVNQVVISIDGQTEEILQP